MELDLGCRSLSDVGLADSCREVVDKSGDTVLHAIEETLLSVAHTILRGDGLSYGIPNRSRGNQLYVPGRGLLQDLGSGSCHRVGFTCCAACHQPLHARAEGTPSSPLPSPLSPHPKH